MRATMASAPSLFLPSLLMLLLPIWPFSAIHPLEVCTAFQLVATTPRTSKNTRCISHRLRATSDDGNDDSVINDNDDDPSTKETTKKTGDSLRDATGIRPSLHPTTINCVAEALLLRSQRVLGKRKNKEGQEIVIVDTSDARAEPLQVAIAAAGIAMAAIDRRKAAAGTTGDAGADGGFTTEESQTLSGRVIGVIVRMRDLERALIRRATDAKWVGRYGEEGSFGVLEEECRFFADGASGASDDDGDDAEKMDKRLAEGIEADPLLRMNRAECLLAVFLSTVEQPQLEKLGKEVAGGSVVDFIDADRLEVLTTT